MKQSHWMDEVRAQDFAGNLLDALIEVSKLTPPKPKEKPKIVDTEKKS